MIRFKFIKTYHSEILDANGYEIKTYSILQSFSDAYDWAEKNTFKVCRVMPSRIICPEEAERENNLEDLKNMS